MHKLDIKRSQSLLSLFGRGKKKPSFSFQTLIASNCAAKSYENFPACSFSNLVENPTVENAQKHFFFNFFICTKYCSI